MEMPGRVMDEDDRRLDALLRDDDDEEYTGLHGDGADIGDSDAVVWEFSHTPNTLGNDTKNNPLKKNDNDDCDDDSSAALSMYLESKLAAVLLSDEEKKESDDIDETVHRAASIHFPLDQNKTSAASPGQSSSQLETDEIRTPSVPKPTPLGPRGYSAPFARSQDQLPLSVSEHTSRTPNLHSLYNPMTGYSPGRSSKKQIWGSSSMQLPRPSSPRHHVVTVNLDDSDESESVTSASSEEILERRSAQIHAELRYAELVELAEEAERAAEAGQETYSGRPWIANRDNDETILRPSSIKRHASYSEGLPMPTSPLRQESPKPSLPAGVQNLRDAEDVFPRFDTFHKNLRTHFLRQKVPQNVLVFEEEHEVIDAALNAKTEEEISDFNDLERRLTMGAQSFMNSFSFDILKQSGSSHSQREQVQSLVLDDDPEFIDDGSHASDVGDVLAEHIHSTDFASRKTIHPVSLPGLPFPETALSLPVQLSHDNHSLSQTNGTPSFGRSPSMEEVDLAKPRVLFPSGTSNKNLAMGVPEDSAAAQNSMVPETPQQKGQSHDFVTPARLREIRRPKDGDTTDFLNDQSMILPANSVIQESPYKSPNPTPSSYRGQPSHVNHHIPVTDLLLPAFSAEEEEPVVQLAPSRSYDESLDGEEVFPNSSPYRDRTSIGVYKTSPRVTTPTGQTSGASPKSRTSIHSLALPSDDGSRGSTLNKSVNSRSERSEAQRRRIVRPSTRKAERAQQHGYAIASVTSRIPAVPLGSFDIDCRCLSPSFEHFQEILEDNDDNLADTNQEGSRIRGAMKMLRKLSPSRKKTAQARDLFVHPQVNDDFLQNYLYSTKDPRSINVNSHGNEGICMTGEPCQDDGFCGVGLALGMSYCGFSGASSGIPTDADCMTITLGRGGNRSQRNSSTEIQPLILTPYKNHAAPNASDGWFDTASERVDGMIENYILGPIQPLGSFQPPSLRKIMRSDSRYASRYGNEESPNRPTVQALFQPTEEDLSDTQFALVYGTSRSSPLREDIVDEPASTLTKTTVSQLDDDDDEEEVLSVIYISEPSLMAEDTMA